MGVISSDTIWSLQEEVLYLPKCKEIIFLIYIRKKGGGCLIIVHKVKCVLNRHCHENFRLWRGNHLICRENAVCHSTDGRCLHSHAKGKGAYSVVPVSLSFALRKSWMNYMLFILNILKMLCFLFTLNYMSQKFPDLFPIHKFLRLK